MDGFTNFFVYNDTQCSGLNNILYFRTNTLMNNNVPGNTQNKSVRKVGNEWRINDFRDMSFLKDDFGGAGLYTLPGTLTPGTQTTTQGQVNYNNIFAVDGMYEELNPDYIDYNKPWHQQKKFIDTYIGIRLINSNARKNLVNLYSTSVAMRKFNR